MSRLLARVLDAFPLIIQTRKRRWLDGKNAFDLGRDHERAAQRGAIK